MDKKRPKSHLAFGTCLFYQRVRITQPPWQRSQPHSDPGGGHGVIDAAEDHVAGNAGGSENFAGEVQALNRYASSVSSWPLPSTRTPPVEPV